MEKYRKRRINLILLMLILLFFLNGYKFFNTEGNDNPLLGPLFNMIIILEAIIFLFHKKEITFREIFKKKMIKMVVV